MLRTRYLSISYNFHAPQELEYIFLKVLTFLAKYHKTFRQVAAVISFALTCTSAIRSKMLERIQNLVLESSEFDFPPATKASLKLPTCLETDSLLLVVRGVTFFLLWRRHLQISKTSDLNFPSIMK